MANGMKTETCLTWETEKPFNEVPRVSSQFWYKGSEYHLLFSYYNYYDRQYCYKLEIKPERNLEAQSNSTLCLDVSTYMNVRGGGGVVLAYVLEKSSTLLWHYCEKYIYEKIPAFYKTEQCKFTIVFHTCSTTDLTITNEKSESGQKNEKSVQTPLHLNSLPCLESISRDFSKLLDGGSQRDVVLKCGDSTLNAHKIVLCSRSEVFARMLDSDMAEARSGLVEVKDMDQDVFEQFIRYLYTGMLPELTVDTAIRFYEAGDKYAVVGLMRRCSDFLVDNLTPENACEVLVLADAHSDQEFKETVITYILNEQIPFQNEHWQAFCNTHPQLAVPVLNRFCELLRSR